MDKLTQKEYIFVQEKINKLTRRCILSYEENEVLCTIVQRMHALCISVEPECKELLDKCKLLNINFNKCNTSHKNFLTILSSTYKRLFL